MDPSTSRTGATDPPAGAPPAVSTPEPLGREELGTRLSRVVDGLQLRLRRLLAWHWAAEVAALALAAVLVSLALDWVFELPWVLRALALVGAVLFLLRALVRGWRRLGRKVSGADILVSVEHSQPEIEGQLLSVVDLRRRVRALKAAEDAGPAAERVEDELLRRALREAQGAVAKLSAQGALDARPVRRRMAAAVAVLVLVVAAACAWPRTLALWAERNVLLSSSPWPRATHFSLLRRDRTWHQARGAPLDIEGWVLGDVPRDVFLDFDSAAGRRRSRLVLGEERRGVFPLDSEVAAGGPAAGEVAPATRVSFRLPSLAESFDFRLAGGDNRSVPVRVEVHERPRVVSAKLRLEPPAYTALPPRELADPVGEVTAPAGTRVSLEVVADVELKALWLRFGKEGRVPAAAVDGRSAEHSFVLQASTFIEFWVEEAEWSFESRPRRLGLVALPDRVPQVRLEVRGEGRRVTPTAIVAYAVEVWDDWGVASLGLVVGEPIQTNAPPEAGAPADGKAPLAEVDLAPWEAQPAQEGILARAERSLDIAPLNLQPGAQFTLQAVAVDNDEPAGGKKGYSTRETFTVTAPEELQAEMDAQRVAVQERIEALAAREGRLRDELAVKLQRPPAPGVESPSTARPATSSSPSSSSSSSSSTTSSASPSSRSSPTPSTSSPSTSAPRTPAEQAATPPQAEGQRGIEALSQEQRQIGEAVRDAAGDLRRLVESLERNQLGEEAERRQIEDEVAAPLDDLGSSRIPRSADEIGSVPRASDPDERLASALEDTQRITRRLEEAAENLKGSGDLREVLQRLESILELQGKVIGRTRKDAGLEGGGAQGKERKW